MKKIASIILLAFFFLPTGIGHSLDIDSPRKYQNISQEIVPSYTPNLFSNFKTTHMVPMRDGIKLATDVYRPVFPPASKTTLLLRTPYNKDDMSLVGILGIILGWPTVIQDMRGRFASEGNDTVFKNENTDGVDTLAWITNQSWSDGKIVTFGPSAMGIPQYCLAGENPENLTCQFVQIATPNLYHHATFQGGEFRKNLVEEWLGDQSSSYMLQEILNNENFTLGYWGNVTLDNNWEKVNIPAIHVGGWYDIFSQGTIDAYCGYQHLAGAGARGNSKLIMGPWTHTGFFQRTQGELIYPRNSLDRFSLRMFRDMVRSYALNDIDTYSCWPTVSYYVMGDVNDPRAPGNEWRFADDWPIPFKETKWYFHDDGFLNTEFPSSDDPLIYLYDPTNPVPTIGGKNLFLCAGPYDQRPVENRSDVLVFTSPLLEQPYEATGPVKAQLFISSDCPDTDFTMKLTDIYPDGRSMFITDGILRMRNRNGQDHWELIQPGVIYEVEVDLWSTSYVWNTGHRIRVEVSSSNYPRFLNNPNTAEGIGKNTTYNIARNMVYVDMDHPSCILLPEPINERVKITSLPTPMSSFRIRLYNLFFSLLFT